MASLVDHYLLQLKSLLPARAREDVAAELGESIHTAIAERERSLGRTINDDELAEILKSYGHPLLVAGRYLPMQELIGPRVFPLYWYALQAVTMVIAVVTGMLAGIALLTTRTTAMQVIVGGFWLALAAAACVTIAFAVLDHGGIRVRFLDTFDPRKLELGLFGMRAAPLSPIPRADTVFELATLAIFVAWWTGALDFVSVLGAGTEIGFTVAIEPFFWPVLALAVVDLGRLSIDFMRPYRTRPRVILRLVINVGWLVALVLAFRTDGLLAAQATGGAVAASTRALTIAQGAFEVVVGVLTVITAGLIATDVVRLLRR